jgi:hypothetical protein
MTRADRAAERVANELSCEDEPTTFAALALACAEALSNMSLPKSLRRDEAAQLFFAQVRILMLEKEKADGAATTQARAPVGD